MTPWRRAKDVPCLEKGLLDFPLPQHSSMFCSVTLLYSLREVALPKINVVEHKYNFQRYQAVQGHLAQGKWWNITTEVPGKAGLSCLAGTGIVKNGKIAWEHQQDSHCLGVTYWLHWTIWRRALASQPMSYFLFLYAENWVRIRPFRHSLRSCPS